MHAMVFVGVFGFLCLLSSGYVSRVEGSCAEGGRRLCCTGRNNTCHTRGKPMDSVLHNETDRCFCDEGCMVLRDCCVDYNTTCKAVDCYTSAWTEWGDCNNMCGIGAQIREKKVLIEAQHGGEPCPLLHQKRVCQGGDCSIQSVELQHEEMQEIGYILPLSFGNWRTDKLYDPSKGINKNLFFHYHLSNKISRQPTYCGTYVITSSREGCNSTDSTWAAALQKGETVCIECQFLAMRKELGLRCKGHGVHQKITKWHAIDVPHCHGEWVLNTKHSPCTCHLEKDKGFIFV